MYGSTCKRHDLQCLCTCQLSSQNGLTALDIASSNEQPEIYQILALNGAVHGTPTQPEVYTSDIHMKCSTESA